MPDADAGNANPPHNASFAMKKVGLFFGSFNPIHIGHLIIGNSMLANSDMDEVWFVVSPQNPLKERATLLADRQRLEMVRLAIDDNYRLRACDIEFHLPIPSYTSTTLAYLAERYPDKSFCLIMGSDNLETFTRWRNWQFIIDNYHLYVYPRPGHDNCSLAQHPHVTLVDVPTMDISSTYIRQQLRRGRDVRYLLPDKVYDYVTGMHFYSR